jgi:hypothetical protein
MTTPGQTLAPQQTPGLIRPTTIIYGRPLKWLIQRLLHTHW